MRRSNEVLDVIVQSCVVDLFHSSGIAVAPLRRSQPTMGPVVHPQLSAMIGFRGKRFTGVLTAGVPDGVFAAIPRNPERPFADTDWIREVANQLVGRIKGRLIPLGTTLQADLPSLVHDELFERLRAQSPFFAVYRFRALRGEVVVTLLGDIDPSIFVYAGPLPTVVEGDIIIF
jgi:hypothetical protein